MKYIIPENISKEWINRRKPKNFIPGYKYERLLYAIHCIAKNLTLGNEINEEGIPLVRLKSEFLKNKMGCHYNKYFEFLKRKKVITISDSYQINVESKKYAFTQPFMVGMKIVDIPESNGELINRRSSKPTQQTFSLAQKNTATDLSNIMEERDVVDSYMYGYDYVEDDELIVEDEIICPFSKGFPVLNQWNSWFNDKLVLDIEWAKNAIEKEKEELILNPQFKKLFRKVWNKKTGKYRKKFISVEVKPETFHARASSKVALFQIRDFKPVHRDGTIGRLFSTIVQTPKVIRPFLTYDGQPLGYLDIKNCQPFLVTGLLNPSFWKTDIPYLAKEYNKFTFCPEKCITNIQEIGYAEYLFPNTPKGRKRYRMVLSAVKGLQGKDDVYYFKQSVTQGTFYKDMEKRILDNKDSEPVTNEFVKESMFTVLFTANQYIGAPDAAAKRKFREIYPHVYELLAAVKSGKGNKSLLSRLLQRLESHIMIDGVATHLTQHYPDIPFFPLHDAIAMPLRHRDLIKAIMLEFVERNTGYKPAVHEKVWGNGFNKIQESTPILISERASESIHLPMTG